MTQILTVDPIRPGRDVLRTAARILSEGGLVAFPTDTVYGLGADFRNSRAVRRLRRVKGREPGKPFPLLLAESAWAWEVSPGAGELARRLAALFWPGPLTLVLPGDGDTGFGVRVPDLALPRQLAAELGGPLAAPSANLSGHPSPIRAETVLEELGGSIDMLLDGGEAALGLESTVLDVRFQPPRLLRPGEVTVRRLREAAGRIEIPAYARPRLGVRLRLLAPGDPVEGSLLHWGAPPPSPGHPYLGAEPLEAARRLLPLLNSLPGGEISVILPPAGGEWEALRERLLWAGGGEP